MRPVAAFKDVSNRDQETHVHCKASLLGNIRALADKLAVHNSIAHLSDLLCSLKCERHVVNFFCNVVHQWFGHREAGCDEPRIPRAAERINYID